ncbi:YbhB/YbcL family Raf kinase inhibitor-like protein [Altererythrobacter aurantiacus]|uniref:YbhB/YbcL family Raf kinase inhibitor-like protein n=1 Tax=Parapontixanthobacter aurantiacus TaxID=1463599 RepID=A0A844ZJQ3_9SPHN|nr:YbhB/YbcL family Raf kinase inhibitor-like protein [Parapontixanthobacter aurantiacus]MXO85929.1 YbhB/YbcL family Raf kinase inhibitor-like protein [Parapontixanthobacter aurantiacus]
MLEHVPEWLGRAMKNVRAGHEKLAVVKLGDAATIGAGGFRLSSPAFTDGGVLDPRFTADAQAPVSPPLAWTEPPAGTRSLVLLVEDPEVPSMEPFVHCLGMGMPAREGALAEGELPPVMGLNSYQKAEWLPPDPPTGHGSHDYVFQLYALDIASPFAADAGRSAALDAMDGHVVGTAILLGTYSRGG